MPVRRSLVSSPSASTGRVRRSRRRRCRSRSRDTPRPRRRSGPGRRSGRRVERPAGGRARKTRAGEIVGKLARLHAGVEHGDLFADGPADRLPFLRGELDARESLAASIIAGVIAIAARRRATRRVRRRSTGMSRSRRRRGRDRRPRRGRRRGRWPLVDSVPRKVRHRVVLPWPQATSPRSGDRSQGRGPVRFRVACGSPSPGWHHRTIPRRSRTRYRCTHRCRCPREAGRRRGTRRTMPITAENRPITSRTLPFASMLRFIAGFRGGDQSRCRASGTESRRGRSPCRSRRR